MGKKIQNDRPDIPPLPTKLVAGPLSLTQEYLIESIIRESGERSGGEQVVLVPSNFVGEALTGLLAEKAMRPLVNVRFLTLLDFAAKILATQGEAPTVADGTVKALLLAHLLEEHADRHGRDCPLRGVVGKKGTVRAALSLFDSFEEARIGVEESRKLRREIPLPPGSRLPDLLSLFEEYSLRLKSAGLLTRSALVRSAVDRFEAPGYDFSVRIFGFYDFTPLQWFLVEKLVLSGLCDEIYFPVRLEGCQEGHFVVDDTSRASSLIPDSLSYCRPIFLRLLNLCAGNIIALSPGEKSAESGLEHTPSLVLSAPDEESELRAVLRLLRGKKEKSFTGIVYRTIPEELALEAQRLLEEYGLKGEVIRGKPLVDSPAVRTLLLLLSCPIENYPRQLVLDVLSSPFFDLSALGTETTGFSLWESLTRRLAITGGDDWETRLTPLMDVRVSETEEEEDEGTRTMSEGARSLLNAVKSLKEVTSPVPKISSFSELASLLESFLSRFILIRGSDEGLGKEEKVLERVAEIIERLRKCDHVGIPFPETSRVPDLLETIFSDESLPTHRAGALRERKGIVIGDAPSLRGISFQETFFLSLSSDAWPSRPVKVPLLSEREKSVLREHLGKMGAGRAFLTKKEENEAEKFLFSFLVSENRIGGVSFLRSDREGKRKSPSPFLLEYLSLHFGLQVYTRGIGRESVGERFLFLPRFPREEELFPGRPSRDEQILLACLKRGASTVRLTLPGMVAETVERTRRTLLSWAEGKDLFPSPDEIGRNITEGREINYTFLDNASKCPYRTFLRYLADVTPLPEPEEVTSLSRRELGIIAHRALHILSRAEKEGRAMTPEESLRKALDDLKGEIPLGFPGLLEPALRELSDAIERTLAVLSEEGDWAPRAFEFSFGERWGRPVKIEVGGREIPLSGKVDRVDEKEGAVRIVDYKYSSTFMKKPEESAASASANQLPLYGYAVSTLLGSKEAQRIEAGYVYLKTRDNPLQTLDVTPGEALFEAWKKSLALLLESISSGAFPPLPDTLFRQDGRKARYCEWCDYRGLCRVYPRFPGGDEAKDSYSLVLEKLSEELPWHRIHRTRL